MLVRDVMNPEVARVAATATFGEAARRMCAVGWSELAVTDEDDALVGVLALGDLLRALFPDLDELVRLGAPLDAAFEAFLEMGRDLVDQPVRRLVITDPVVVAPDDRLLRAATVMVSRQIHRLFVVDGGRVVGTVGRADICRGALTP
jgi:CBS domain-containing protein